MASQFSVVDREIPHSGACYLICRAFDPSDFSGALARLTDVAFDRGAGSVSVCCRDAGASLPRDGFCAGPYRFLLDGDYYLLFKDLTAAAGPAVPPLSVKPLRPGNAALYQALYNEAFYSVLNARTLDESEWNAMLADRARGYGFFLEGGMPVGVYALSLGEQIPEIAALAVTPDLRGKGYGRRALLTLERMLSKDGHSRVQLLVSSQNQAAMALYRSAGYGGDRLHSTWFRTKKK